MVPQLYVLTTARGVVDLVMHGVIAAEILYDSDDMIGDGLEQIA